MISCAHYLHVHPTGDSWGMGSSPSSTTNYLPTLSGMGVAGTWATSDRSNMTGGAYPSVSVGSSYSTSMVHVPCFSVTLHSQSASVFSSRGICLKHTRITFANFTLRQASMTAVTRAY